jgi:hypothetical protein
MADGQFLGDIAVSVGPQGTILVADSGNHKIQKFDSNGTLVTSWRFSNESASNEMVTQPQGEPESVEDEQSAEVIEEIIAPQSASSSSSSSSSSSTPEPAGILDDTSSEASSDSSLNPSSSSSSSLPLLP